jgi:hypothetical protein
MLFAIVTNLWFSFLSPVLADSVNPIEAETKAKVAAYALAAVCSVVAVVLGLVIPRRYRQVTGALFLVAGVVVAIFGAVPYIGMDRRGSSSPPKPGSELDAAPLMTCVIVTLALLLIGGLMLKPDRNVLNRFAPQTPDD